MREKLVKDYLSRVQTRIKMLDFLINERDFADVVREAQEIVELLLKALLLNFGFDVIKTHDVSKFIEANLEFFPHIIKENIERIKYISRELRKERELSFYGAEDWIPGEEYTDEDANKAIGWCLEINEIVKKAIL